MPLSILTDSSGSPQRVATRVAIEFAKELRTEGYRVEWCPGSGPPTAFFIRKGFTELVRDPLILMAASVPTGVLTSLIASWLYSRFQKDTNKTEGFAPEVGIEASIEGETTQYRLTARGVEPGELAPLLRILDRRCEAFGEAQRLAAADGEGRWPIFLEHSDRLIGWASIAIDERGLKVTDGHIIDDEVWTWIAEGTLKGLSFGGIVREAECSVCCGDYLTCPHKSGEQYGEVVCVNHIADIDLAEISVVAVPANSHALLQLRAAEERRRR